MITACLFAVAAAAGALARAEAGRRWNRPGMPAGTFVVNVTGSFLLGLLSEVGPPAVTVLGVGGLGAYTTFSGFAREIALLGGAPGPGTIPDGRPGRRRRLGAAAIYVVASCGAGIVAAAAGIAIAS